MNKMKLTALAVAALVAASAPAAEPDGYYDAARGKSKGALLAALESCISDHTTIGYSAGLEDLYKTSDTRADGSLWDMYSTSSYSIGNACGNYKNVGDCWNREHSMPKSWFNKATPMYSDAFHVYPTDGKVNGQRGNLPYGECANGTTLPSNGNVRALGRKGTCTYPGYSGDVFEPDDEYKGDLARTYFYMAACYNSKIDTWSSGATNLAGNSYPAFKDWSVNMLMEWHRNDPVSQKELDRQEAVYAKQGNRNPFIDHPELAEYVWGENKDDAGGWQGTASTTPKLTTPTNGSTITVGTTSPDTHITKSVAVKGVNLTEALTLTLSGSYFTLSTYTVSAAEANAGATIAITYAPAEVGSHTATLTLRSSEVSSTVTLKATAAEDGGNGNDPSDSEVYTKITTVNDLTAGRKLLIVYESDSKALTTTTIQSGNGGGGAATVTINRADNVNTITLGSSTAHPITLGGSTGEWTLYDEAEKYYLGLLSDSNALHYADTQEKWAITFNAAGQALLSPKAYSERVLKYNTGAGTPFRCYGTTQSSSTIYYITLYQQNASSGEGPEPTATVSATPDELRFESEPGTTPARQSVNITVDNAPAGSELIVEALGDYSVSATADGEAVQSLTLSPLSTTIYVEAMPQNEADSYPGAVEITLGNVATTVSLSHVVTEPAEEAVAPDALEATSVMSDSFVARWTAVESAHHYELEVTEATVTEQPASTEPTQIFVEGFDLCAGQGGNDGNWSGISNNASPTASTDGWTFSNAKAGSACVSVGTGKSGGTVVTPEISDFPAEGFLTFRAGAWANDTNNTIQVTIRSTDGNGTVVADTVVTLAKGAFETHTVPFTATIAAAKVSFVSVNDSKNRFMLDDVELYKAGEASGTESVTSYTSATYTDITGTSYRVPAKPLTAYSYRVRSVLASGTASEWSDSIDLTTPAADAASRGDVNTDGAVDGNDVSALLEMVLAGGVDDEQKAVADVNADGNVDGNDVSALLEMVLAGE